MKEKKEQSDVTPEELISELSRTIKSPKGKYDAESGYLKFKARIPSSSVKLFPFLRHAIAASIILLAGLSVVYYLNIRDHVPMMVCSTADYRDTVCLADGTRVELNRFSRLEYPENFTKKIREVVLSGEAYFEVESDPAHPFIVSAEEVRVKVLGTHFNVEAYPGDPCVRTTLLEGAVSVSNTVNDEAVRLQPNEAALFDKTSARISFDPAADVLSKIAWRNGELVFNTLPISEICRKLSNHFNRVIEIEDEQLKMFRITARFNSGETLEDILDLLQVAGRFTYREVKGKIVIEANTFH